MLPLADFIVSSTHDILATGPTAAVHPEIPANTFVARHASVSSVWRSLENNPARPTGWAGDIAIVHRSRTGVLAVTRRPEPGFKSEWNARVGVVFRNPRHGRS